MQKQTLAVLPYSLVIHSLAVDAAVPESVYAAPLYFIGKTPDELSVVAPDSVTIDATESDHDWRALKVIGPLDLTMVGVMAQIGKVLANAKVSIFVLSTFDTDYVLVKEKNLTTAIDALSKDGYTVNKHE